MLRRQAMIMLCIVAVVVVVLVAAIRIRDPESQVDTAATYGFLTLVVFQIAKLGGIDDSGPPRPE
jgi:hypothetical protein